LLGEKRFVETEHAVRPAERNHRIRLGRLNLSAGLTRMCEVTGTKSACKNAGLRGHWAI